MVEVCLKFLLKFILRDEYLEIMDVFLINGGCFIFKVIFMNDEDWFVLGIWGLCLAVVQQIVMVNKIVMQEVLDMEVKKGMQ